jgi:signal transduction histidine kinase/DNA-binding response OmpR family regulator
MHGLHPWPWLLYEQDYLWFLTIMGWLGLAAAWWRFACGEGRLAWIPWAALAGVLTAGVEISQLVTPVKLTPWVAPWEAWDLALGGVGALLAGGLWWEAAVRGTKGGSRFLRVLPMILVAVLAVWRQAHPEVGSWAIAGVVAAAAILFAGRRECTRMERWALAAFVASVACGTAGPLAERLALPHRYSEISVFGPWTTLCQFLAIAAAGRALYRHAIPETALDTAAELRRLFRALTLWMAAGLFLAGVMSHWARERFNRDVLSRARLSASLLNPDALESALGPGFRIDQLFELTNPGSGQKTLNYRSRWIGTGVMDPFSRVLSDIERAIPEANWALLLTARGGLIVIACTSLEMPSYSADAHGVFSEPNQTLWDAWSRRQPEVLGPINLAYGDIIQARAPVIGRNNNMLGWLALDFGVASWVAAQAQTRVLAFAVVAFGCGLLVSNWQKSLRERESRRAKNEAEAVAVASRLKTDFLAKVSHELRTPIQSLLGYSDLLRQHVCGDPKAANWLAALQQHGELMTRLVNDLIDLSAVEAGAFQLSPRPMAPADVLAQTVESFRPRAEARGLALAYFIDPATPSWVSLDIERFRQIAANLVSNAIKFTDRGGVTVSLRSDMAGHLILSVRDTGPGIPPDQQHRLFMPFSRLKPTAAKEGSGLGLALSAALCQAMSGELRVESDGSTGSCFIAIFPAVAVAPPSVDSALPDIPTLRGRRILVVDDTPLVRELFVAFLTENGALCAAAATGAEALVHARGSPFDSIVLDLALPDGDGTEFIASLRRDAPGARIIGVSAHATGADRARALGAGMDVFLTKPTPLAKLAGAIVGGAPEARLDYRRVDFGTAGVLRERLSRQFREEIPAHRTRLESAIVGAKWSEVQSLAHHLKNSAVVVHDDVLFDACTGLEQASADADAEGVSLWQARCLTALHRWQMPDPISADGRAAGQLSE